MQKIFEEAGLLTGLIDYQDGAVVSKEIIKKDKGIVTLFAFSAGQGLSEHTVPFDAFVYILEGKAEIAIFAIVHHLSAGEAIVMQAHKPHALKAIEPFKMLLVMIRA